MAKTKGSKKQYYKRMAKHERQTFRLWAEGARETLLTPHIAPYADALSRSWVHERDYVANVQNHYHRAVPWRLPDHEEPPLPLPDYEPSWVPPRKQLTEEEQKLKSEVIARRNK
ncbi:hypothetical protein HWV62_1747, partial [Athelia sp. TMB]